MDPGPTRLCKRCGPTRGPLPVLCFREHTLPTKDGPLKVRRKLCWDCEKEDRKDRYRKRGEYAPVAVPIVALGDVHAPWHHRPALDWALEVVKKTRPRVIVQVGDLLDQFAFSKYPRDHRVASAEEELEQGRAVSSWLWDRLGDAAPGARRIQLLGNHDDRPIKRVLERCPELMGLVGPGVRDLFTFPGVETIHDSKAEVDLNGCWAMHGYLTRLGDHALFNRRNTIVGHSHRGGVMPFNEVDGQFWELNVGWLGNISAPVFGYRAQRNFSKSTLGLGIVDSLGPRFCPYS